jgi:hypothetical protein
MKRILIIAAVLLVALSASSVFAANTYWVGKYSCMDSGIWKGTIVDNGPIGMAPYFEGKWASVDATKYGKMYATLKSDGFGNYKIIKGVLYDEKGNEVGMWNGSFTLMVKPGHGEGGWAWIWSPYIGQWKGQLALTEEE